MLWQKTWFDTRWRFLIGLALLLVAACSTLYSFRMFQSLLPTVGAVNLTDGPLSAAIEEAVDIQRTFRGYVWYQWFDGNLMALATLFAALLGTGGPLTGRGVAPSNCRFLAWVMAGRRTLSAAVNGISVAALPSAARVFSLPSAV